jgi:curved DNA-binding protein CbpA
MHHRTHYDVLGLSPTASADEIRRAWKTLIQVWHPDRFNGRIKSEAEETTKALNEAYTVLSDPASRSAYDREALARSRAHADESPRPTSADQRDGAEEPGRAKGGGPEETKPSDPEAVVPADLYVIYLLTAASFVDLPVIMAHFGEDNPATPVLGLLWIVTVILLIKFPKWVFGKDDRSE